MKDIKSKLFRVCPQTGKVVGARVLKRRMVWLYPALGLAALVWFLVRVVPKPSRATYPCQRVAGPLASGFLLWLLGASGSALALRRAGERLGRVRYLNAVVAVAMVVAGLGWVLLGIQEPTRAAYPPHLANTPLGVARGLQPGRVAWVHDPDVTDWAGPGTGERWHEHVDQAVTGAMVSQGLRTYAGESGDAAAWNAIFAHYNRGPSYQGGQKIMIKINLTTANAGSGSACDDGHYSQTECGSVSFDSTANSPQLMHALLSQLVDVVGVAESDITIGDPTGLFVNYLFNPLHDDFPDVNYLDNRGGEGEPGEWRTRAQYTDPCVPHYWSTAAAEGKTQDCLLTAFDEATYVINFSVLKSHNGGGITVSAKNHYGSMLRTPVGGGRRLGNNYYDLHHTLPGDGCRDVDAMKTMGQYRALVDLMGLDAIGGKTVLYLVDGIFGGRDWYSVPSVWSLSPFDGGWPSSLLVSMDPVAIDSVAHDLLAEQWPEQVLKYEGTQDYLHEAALAAETPSGTCYDPEGDGTCMDSLGAHEHWNNPTDKLYSRNLDRENGTGIELVYMAGTTPPVSGTSAYLPLLQGGEKMSITKRLDEARKAFDKKDLAASGEAHSAEAIALAAEQHGGTSHQYIGDMVYGGLDGIVTTFAVVSGVAGAGLGSGIILILGLANLLADGLSMAAGAYLSLKSEREYYDRERQRESWEVEHFPEGEQAEMLELYKAKGYSEEDADALVKIQSQRQEQWVDVMMVQELGLLPDDRKPVLSAVATFSAFLVAGSVPLLTYFVGLFASIDPDLAFTVSILLSGLALFGLGAAKVLVTERSWFRSGLEMLVVGGIAAGVAYLVGYLLQGLVG